MNMIQNNVVNRILKFKDHTVILNGFVLLGEAAIAHIIEENTEIISMWWYILTLGIGIVINFIFTKIYDHRIRKRLSDYIQEENYEIATMIVERGVITPSSIKPILESITEIEEH